MLIIRYIVGAVLLFVFVKGLIELLGRCKDSSYVWPSVMKRLEPG